MPLRLSLASAISASSVWNPKATGNQADRDAGPTSASTVRRGRHEGRHPGTDACTVRLCDGRSPSEVAADDVKQRAALTTMH